MNKGEKSVWLKERISVRNILWEMGLMEVKLKDKGIYGNSRHSAKIPDHY